MVKYIQNYKGEIQLQDFKLPHNHGHDIEKLVEQLPHTDDFLMVSDLFRLLGDSSRLRIFWILCHCEECVINISAMMSMSSPAVSHHLKQLKSAGLIISRREGKEVYYRAALTKQVELLHNMLETLVVLTCPGNECIVKKCDV